MTTLINHSSAQEHHSRRQQHHQPLSSASTLGPAVSTVQVMPSTRLIILSLALLVFFASSLIFFLTFASFAETWRQVNNSNNSSFSNNNFKAMTISELLNANLGAITEVACVLVAPNRCLPLVEVNLATLFAIDHQQKQNTLTADDAYKDDNNNNSCQLISIIQNLCFSRQSGQFKVVSMFLFKQNAGQIIKN